MQQVFELFAADILKPLFCRKLTPAQQFIALQVGGRKEDLAPILLVFGMADEEYLLDGKYELKEFLRRPVVVKARVDHFLLPVIFLDVFRASDTLEWG